MLLSKIPIEEMFHSLYRKEIDQDHGGEEQEEQRGRRHKAQIGGQRGQGQENRCRHYNESSRLPAIGWGGSSAGFSWVRMMKITSTCVAIDSMNQPV